MLGFGLFLMVGLGYPMGIVGVRATGLATEIRMVFALCNMVFLMVGMTGVALFTRRVFRPDVVWSSVVVVLIFLGYGVCLAAQLLDPGLAAYVDNPYGPWRQVSWISLLGSGWVGFESLRYHLLLRKRLRLGLADPVVTNRFLLWATGMLAAAVIAGVTLVFGLLGVRFVGTAIGGLVVGPLGLVISGSMWLAFLPPRTYVAWLRRHSRAPA